jgi:RHS repeat-associated protein
VDLFYIHADHLNTPRKISRPSDNAIVWRWNSDPFGTTAVSEDPDGDSVSFAYSLRFPGQYYDSETGLHYNYKRDYDPAIGRYIQSDPIGLDGGLNTYLYADADPILNIDPTGEAGGPAAGAAAAGYAAFRICRAIPRCKQQLAELMKKAAELCKKVKCTVRFDKKGHPFEIPGQGTRLCMHWQIDCHIEGVKRSDFSIHSRLPICWKQGEPFPTDRPPPRLP